ncbi:acylphosphatase [Salsuginibacillus halophilus]|uniref:Acylphosphatase n=1 Tax=Salsuginibacillus halophilus TaxID=517424 RepID=A0A2P8HG48_9BACI|nr:acylphosphatase [Salsuginibacillus halophilus]PSL45193.1 acylphosphatase [Salsuginibacillus halophilus]
MIKYEAVVHGRVQGVGFRQFTQQAAMRHNVFGWVQNEDDGTVRLAAEGTAGQMDAFLSEVRKGSPVSKVTEVDVQEVAQVTHNDNFRITK